MASHIQRYGPTEATCAILLGELFPGGPITVGWPIWYSKIILVNPDGECTDEEGEIYVGGAGLALGYYGNDEATNKSFVMHNGERYYRTGDLARLTCDGYVFRGRMDMAMKIENSLVAFITPRVDISTVRQYLSANLSTFLVPDTIYALDEFPQTTNGKCDRKSLLSLHQAEAKKLISETTMSSSNGHLTPVSLHGDSAISAVRLLSQKISAAQARTTTQARDIRTQCKVANRHVGGITRKTLESSCNQRKS
ncbi:acetyl-CoA synthetase-like protein [Aspergillus eucalypticola CBS 122712]|uniref:Acetyl-CoA synthetase-like protein n=1 Tax=Aspergillus eucalypticola (strain CBS 122712 / IBT 29274) TaxID=1448314 RepID=A0A317UT59_ASPEC|nr:acetyl-CoA synthetase-like protein [Aspergillus eucalypticola CBS 122712]PWY64805.1 acetyl-CoA synthetase-like protein [Aspergillus eucalypticola CBS 122712]